MDATEAVEGALRAVAGAEGAVRAWAHLDAGAARASAAAVDRRGRDGGPLRGLTLGVKDVFDTGDQPTAYGSPIFAGHRPVADAGAVALLRGAGAVMLGKTVTAELAMYTPGPTANPHRLTHTPGGSSSGSAAAVACGMADIALGTQTAGSVVRPASFCGVFGFKPTFGTVTVAGLKLVAPSLDTVGWFARTVAHLDAVRVVLTGRPPVPPAAGPPPVLAVVPTEMWSDADRDSRRAVEEAARRAAAAGATVTVREAAADLDGLAGEQAVVMAYEASRSLAWEHRARRGQLSPGALSILDAGSRVDPATYDRIRHRAESARSRLDDLLFGPADVVLTVAAGGEAPAGLDSTGDPRFSRLWTLLGLPTLSVPGLVGSTGLPVGVQLVGRPGADGRVLAAGTWLAGHLPRPRVPAPVSAGPPPAGPRSRPGRG